MFSIALITGIGVGMATMVGSLMAFFIHRISHKLNDIILGFAAGIMLGAAFFSLILPSIGTGVPGIAIPALGILCGAVLITLLDRFVPHMHKYIGVEAGSENRGLMLFVLAIAIHNFPEGMAVGVSFATGNTGNAASIAIAIALQNIPEGLITVSPLLMAGVKKRTALFLGLATGMVELAGTLIGYAVASVAGVMLPFMLALAGGTMVYVIGNDIISETHSHGYQKQASYALIVGVIVMLMIDHFV